METNNNNLKKQKIGFKPSYMTEDQIYESVESVNEIPNLCNVDPILKKIQLKILEMTLEFTTKRFARLSQKTKMKKILDYNMLIQIELKLANRI